MLNEMSDDEILELFDSELKTDRLTTEQSRMLANMADRQNERLKKVKTNVVSHWFPITELTKPAVIGTYSISGMVEKKKWIHRQYVRSIGSSHYCTPGDIARDYLILKYPKRNMRITTRQYQDIMQVNRTPPLFCQPVQLENAHYVDIRSAYWTITKLGGWDVDYSPGRFMCVRSDNSDFPYFFDKLARNTLVTAGLLSPLRVWTGSSVEIKSKPGNLANRVLWAFVMDVLNGVAYDAVRAGAVYCFTDGYIVPDSKLQSVLAAIESWGLPVSIKHSGKADVRMVASYRVGKHRTRPYRRSMRRAHINKIHPVYIDWLRFRVRKFWEKRERLYLDADN